MWLDKIIEEKRNKNITTKMMAEKSRIPEQTITRILTKKTEFPRIDTVLDLGASVGLSARELFEETISVIGDKSIETLQEELDRANAALTDLQEKIEAMTAVIDALKNTLDETKHENDILRVKLECKDELICLYSRYTTIIDGMSK